jgi:tRNA1Val (adenine37-N6)-methyltransferase
MSTFNFKHFSVSQSDTTMKVGTDAMLLGSLVKSQNPTSILDIGTGTGVIALMMAQRFGEAQVQGIEVDQNACIEAGLNFKRSSWSDRLSAVHGDVLNHEFDQTFDLVVSNPPYYENSLLSDDDRTSRAKHAEFLPVRELLKKVKQSLTSNGQFWVIIPAENTVGWIDAARSESLVVNQSISIIGKEGQGEKRSVLVFGNEAVAVIYSTLTIRDRQNRYTKEYIELTKEFHDRDLSQ